MSKMFPGERGELKNPWIGRGSRKSKSQWTGSIRIQIFSWRRLCDCDPDDEREDGDAVGGDRRVGKGDRDCGQGTGRGDNDRNDNRCVEGRLSFYFERKFHAKKLRKGGNCIKKCKECAG